MVCNGCGRTISDDSTKCEYCFEEVEKIDVEKYKKSFMPQKNAKELIITFVLILILVLIGYILYHNITNFTSGEGLKKNNTNNNIIEKAKDITDEYNKKIEDINKVME